MLIESKPLERTLYIIALLLYLSVATTHVSEHWLIQLLRALGWWAGLSLTLNITFHISMTLLHRPWKKNVLPMLRGFAIYWMRLTMRNHRFLAIVAGVLALIHGTSMLVAAGKFGTPAIIITGVASLLLLLTTLGVGVARGWSRRTHDDDVFRIVKKWHPRIAYATVACSGLHLLVIVSTGS